VAGTVKRTAKNTGNNRGRRRAPAVSVLISLFLVIACVIFVSIRYLRGNFGGAENNDTQTEPTVSYEPPESPAETIITEQSEGAEALPVEKTPAVNVKGIFVAAWYVGTEDGANRFIEICDSSEINAIVIDVKDDFGKLSFVSNNESISAAGSSVIPDIEQTVSRLKEHGIYVIARLVCFKDPLWCDLNPSLAIHDNSGATWRDANGVAWLDPYNTGAWEYIAAVAKEAARVGFDEIQLDYVRFPAEGNLSAINFGSAGAEKTKAEIIGSFLEYIRTELLTTPAWLSADAFGIIAVREGDFENIGQDLDVLLQSVDYVCPMIYPSHFAHIGQNGAGQSVNGILIEIPDIEPYKMIYNILQMVKSRMPGDGNHAVVRPYLQAFTASWLGEGYYQTYTAQQVLEQIQAVRSAGFDEWILWNPSGDISIYENVSSLISSENSAGSSSGTPAVSNA